MNRRSPNRKGKSRAQSKKKTLAAIVLTRSGMGLANKLRRHLPGLELFCPAHLGASGRGVHPFHGRLADVLKRLAVEYDALVCVMALAIVVRLLGRIACDRASDPATVVVDDAGRFAISVLGGHRHGANELARRIAEILGAMPVITTASDVLGLPAVDLIGHELGWTIERTQNLTATAAAVVNQRPVAVFQDVGPEDWWRPFGPWPVHFQRIVDLGELDDRFAAALIISDRAIPDQLAGGRMPYLVYRPRTLYVGVGCRRGVAMRDVMRLFNRVMRDSRLARASVHAVATATLKESEPALLSFASRLGVALWSFSAERLGQAGSLATPSKKVFEKIGIEGVAEPAAMLAAGSRELVVTKQKTDRVTLAIARDVRAIAGQRSDLPESAVANSPQRIGSCAADAAVAAIPHRRAGGQ